MNAPAFFSFYSVAHGVQLFTICGNGVIIIKLAGQSGKLSTVLAIQIYAVQGGKGVFLFRTGKNHIKIIAYHTGICRAVPVGKKRGAGFIVMQAIWLFAHHNGLPCGVIQIQKIYAA